MAKIAAIPALVILIMGFLLNLPDEANIGIIILDSFDNALCENNKDNIACKQLEGYKLLIRIIGLVLIIGDSYYIYRQFQEGNIL